MSNDHSDQKTINNLTNMLTRLAQAVQQDKKQEKYQKLNSSPNVKILKNKKKPETQFSKLDRWLEKKMVTSSPILEPPNVKTTISSNTEDKLNTQKLNNSKKKLCEVSDIKTEKVGNSKQTITAKKRATTSKYNIKYDSNTDIQIKNSPTKQSTLTSLLTERHKKKKTIRMNDSSDSYDLPTFTQIKKGKITKSSKTKEQKASFKKYGIIIPTVDEILKDMEDLKQCKNQLESFKSMSEDSLNLPFLEQRRQSCVKDSEECFDCKHLTSDELTWHFENNINFLSGIFNEKIKNSRHQRYYSNENNENLTYSTSTVVFNYEQIHYLMGLLNKVLDPDNTKTQYFFQVLLPELCLRIFMETHDMMYEDAVKYLNERPIVE